MEYSRLNNLKKLHRHGRLSPKLKEHIGKLIKALEKEDRDRIWKLAMVHQHISSGWKMKEYPHNEDREYNMRKLGLNAYHETDMIAHGDY